MVVYTEDEVIQAQDRAAADAVRDVAEQRDRAMVENTELRRKLNDCQDAIQRIVGSPTIANVCGWYPEIIAAEELVKRQTGNARSTAEA